MAYENGKIIKIKGTTAFIEINKKPECEGCKACVFNKDNKTIIPALMEKEFNVGDRVIFSLAPRQYLFAPLFLFGIPLILFLIGLFVGKAIGGEILMLVLGFSFASIGFMFAVLIDKMVRTNKNYMPLIIEKILITSEDKIND